MLPNRSDRTTRNRKYALHEAVGREELQTIKDLLDQGANADTKNCCGLTPLYIAIEKKYLRAVSLLLVAGARIDYPCSTLWRKAYTPLHLAAEQEDEDIVKLLLTNGASANVEAKSGMTPLHIAVTKSHLPIVKDLLRHGANVNCLYTSTRKKGFGPLHIAVENRHKKIVRLLLNAGAAPEVYGSNGVSPLFIAIEKECVQIVTDLLEHGANINCVYNLQHMEGYTPLHFASEIGNQKIVKLLLDNTAAVNASTVNGITPIYIATEKRHGDVVKILLEYGADPDARDNTGKTILSLAVETDQALVVEYILAYRPNISIPSNQACIIAAVYKDGDDCRKIVKSLLRYGFIIDPKHPNNGLLLCHAISKGYTKIVADILASCEELNSLPVKDDSILLHIAVKHKYEEVVKVLIKYKADVNAKDEDEKLPIFYAIENADLKNTQLLLSNGTDVAGTPELLNLAVRKQCKEIVEILLEHGADVNATNEHGRTALHFTAFVKYKDDYKFSYDETNINLLEDNNFIRPLDQTNCPCKNPEQEIAELLISKGADVNAQTKKGNSVLHIAVNEGCLKLVESLLTCKANVHLAGENDFTPLHCAARKDDHKIARILLTFGADIDCTDENDKTPLHIACDLGNDEVVHVLLEYGSNINLVCNKNRTPFEIAKFGIKKYYSARLRPRINPVEDDDDDEEFEVVHDDDSDCLCMWEGIFDDILEQVIMLRAANLYVCQKNLNLDDDVSIKEHLRRKSTREVKSMKREKISNNNMSFYDILTKSVNELAIYTRNENVVQGLRLEDYRAKFPIYANMINSHIRKAVLREKLLREGNNIFSNYVGTCRMLPYMCTEHIFNYVSDKDLRNFIDAYASVTSSDMEVSIGNASSTSDEEDSAMD